MKAVSVPSSLAHSDSDDGKAWGIEHYSAGSGEQVMSHMASPSFAFGVTKLRCHLL